MFNINELSRVENANPRGGGVDYDLAYSFETGKFRISQQFYDKIDAQNNGFTLYEDKSNERLVLASEPNETSVMYKGREGYDKGKEFTSSRMRTLLNKYGFDGVGEFELEQIHQEGESTYFTFSALGESEGKSSDERSVGSPPADNDEGDTVDLGIEDETDSSIDELSDEIV